MEHITEIARRVGEYVSRPIKLPGFVALLLAAISFIPDWKARWDFWVGTFQTGSLVTRVIVSVLTSPFLGFGLIAIGLVYLYFARGVVHVRYEEQSARPSGASVNTLWPIRDLFNHIHPQPFKSDVARDAVGKQVIDCISSGQIGVWGRRIEGSKRSALEPIPFQNWRFAKLTYWFLDDGNEQSLHVDCPISGERGAPSRQYADVRVNREQAEEIWAYIPLKDAARIAYERARESPVAKIAESIGKSPEGVLQIIASTIFAYHPVHAQKPPSTLREVIPQTEKQRLHIFSDCDGIGYVDEKRPVYVGALVAGSNLEAFIHWAQTDSGRAEPPMDRPPSGAN